MVNKKGYIRTLEAVIGIVIILLFIFSVTPKSKSTAEEVPFVVKNSLDFMTAEINGNEEYRTAVYSVDVEACGEGECQEELTITPFISDNAPPGYTYNYKICDDPSCIAASDNPEVSVYTADTFVSPPTDDQDPRLVRIWLWRSVE